MLNVGLNAKKIAGSKFDITGKLGQNKFASARYTFDMPGFPTLNVEAMVSGNSGDVFTEDARYHINKWGHKERVFISNLRWTKFHFNIGAANEYFGVNDWMTNDVSALSPEELSRISRNYLSAYADARVYTLDKMYYPKKGTDFRLNYEWVFACPGMKDFEYKHIVYFNLKHVFPMGEHFAVITDLYGRTVFNNPDDTFVHDNFIGGDMFGRFISQRIPFLGFNEAYHAGNHLASVEVDFRANIFKNFFASTKVGVFKTANTIKEEMSSFKPTAYGVALEAGYNSIVGPVKVNVHWSDLTKSVGTYISFGYDF